MRLKFDRLFIVILSLMILTGCLGGRPVCYTGCGDRHDIKVTDLRVTSVERNLTKRARIRDLTLRFKFSSNFKLAELKTEYKALHFRLADPFATAADNGEDIYANVDINKFAAVANRQYEYGAFMFLQRNASYNNFDKVLAKVEKDGGLYFVPSMVRFGHFPTYVKFKKVFVKIDAEKLLPFANEEWER